MIKRKGDFIQLENGTWAIDKRVCVNGEWKHLGKRGYKNLFEAKADLDRVENEFINNFIYKETNVNEPLFDDLIERYKQMRKRVVSETTLSCDYSIYNVYLFPYFKGVPIKDVFQEETIQDWYNNIVDSNKYTNNKKSKVITRMKDIMDFAWQKKYISSDIHQDCKSCLYQVKYSKKAETERVIWTPLEEHNFISATKSNKMDYLMFRLFLCLGTRIGEFLALQGQSFNYEKRRITIDHQVKNIIGKGIVYSDELKTHDSYRTITIPNDISEILKDYIDTMYIKDNDFLFHSVNDKKEPMSRTTFRRKLYYYCEIADVRKCNPHAVRHQQAVKLASVCITGEDIETAAHRLGHSTSVFLDTYANHRNEERENTLLDRLYKA